VHVQTSSSYSLISILAYLTALKLSLNVGAQTTSASQHAGCVTEKQIARMEKMKIRTALPAIAQLVTTNVLGARDCASTRVKFAMDVTTAGTIQMKIQPCVQLGSVSHLSSDVLRVNAFHEHGFVMETMIAGIIQMKKALNLDAKLLQAHRLALFMSSAVTMVTASQKLGNVTWMMTVVTTVMNRDLNVLAVPVPMDGTNVYPTTGASLE